MLQKTVAISSCKFKYIALKEAIKKALYLMQLFTQFNENIKLNYIKTTPIILINNKKAKQLAKNLEFYKKLKHIDIIYYFSRKAIKIT